MAFHPDKCNVILVTRNKKPIEFDYTLHGHTLDHVTKAEYLGVTISSDLKWGSHINNINSVLQDGIWKRLVWECRVCFFCGMSLFVFWISTLSFTIM
jgi:hypothetical protein